MTSYALTLIANPDISPLEAAHVEQVAQRLEGQISAAIKVDWLADREACDLLIDSALSSDDVTLMARDALFGQPFDVVCTLAAGRQKKILISDMDSTIINQECINELGNAIGLGEQISDITRAVITGDISFKDALRKRLALMKGMKRGVLEDVYKNYISLMPGAHTFVQTMRHHGAYCILVSGGFTFFTSRISEHLGFHDHQANRLAFEGDKLTGEIQSPILGRSAKLMTLEKLCDEQSLTPLDVLAVGDGANDIKMIKAAGLGVAYHGSSSLKENANAWIDHGDLTALLYIQGFRKSEFVTALGDSLAKHGI